MRTRSLVAAMLLLLARFLSSSEQGTPPKTADYEKEAALLRLAPSQKYEFKKAVLGDVIRYLGQDAKISFFAPPDNSPGMDRLITISLEASPFKALETLCRANGYSLEYVDTIWYIRLLT